MREFLTMHYIYLIKSQKNQSQTYIGYTINLEQRLETHNSGGSVFTAESRPWELVMYLAFSSEVKAREFEKYIKVGSGHAFAKKRLW